MMEISQQQMIRSLGLVMAFALRVLFGGGGEEGGDNQEEPTQGLEQCLEGCGDGCPPPDSRICGSNGERYCNSCVMQCYGVEAAMDPSICEES